MISVNSLRAKSIFGDSAASQVWRDGDTYQLWGLGLAGRFSDSLIEFDHQDATGSINMTTASNGVINGNLEMDAYGDLESATGNLQWGQTPYRYIGGLNCQSEALATFGGGTSGGDSYRLVLMGERWYDPQAGRFISRDPVFSENLYAYCGNDPINSVDPEGKTPTIIAQYGDWVLAAIDKSAKFLSLYMVNDITNTCFSWAMDSSSQGSKAYCWSKLGVGITDIISGGVMMVGSWNIMVSACPVGFTFGLALNLAAWRKLYVGIVEIGDATDGLQKLSGQNIDTSDKRDYFSSYRYSHCITAM